MSKLFLRFAQLLTLGPMAFWLLAILAVLILSGPFGCTINEAGANPCTVGGFDLAEAAYTLGIFAAWGVLLLLPVIAVGGLLWVVAVAVRKRRR
jgi:hypothetical protein